MNLLITAIGSMSAACAIERLKSLGHTVVGCDIYPGNWHGETALCDEFYKVPFATDTEAYIAELLRICKVHNISHLIPLTDLEIDILNTRRDTFTRANITLCMPDEKVLNIARNKYNLYMFFKDDEHVPSIPTALTNEGINAFPLPCVAKPCNGRSSEGLQYVKTSVELEMVCNKPDYILQEQKKGNVFTVDYVRSRATGDDFAVPREELLRTKNGAGLTVKITPDEKLIQLVSYIGKKLDVNGCINMEFIYSDGTYYLIDINPRFSAGVAYSCMLGFDMVESHINCYTNKNITKAVDFQSAIITKVYVEQIIK